MRRMGGWLRLWIVLTAMYAVAVAVVAISVAPSRKEVFASWTQEIFQTIEADVERISGQHIPAAQFRQDEELRKKSDEQIARELTKSARDIDLTQPGKPDLGPYQKKMASLATKYEDKLESLRAEQARTAAYALVFWLVPSLSVLVLGWAVRWVARGFNRGH